VIHRINAAQRLGLKEVPLVIEEDMDDERAFAMMRRENSESYGISASADAGVIAGLIAGAVEGRLTLGSVDKSTPFRMIYLATKESGKLQIAGPGGKIVEAVLGGTSQLAVATSPKLFTTHTLAMQLNWTRGNVSKEGGFEPSKRFHAAFDVLTKLILPGAASPTELEGLNQREVNAVAEGASEAAATVVEPLRAWA
jgi:hypothetical protein